MKETKITKISFLLALAVAMILATQASLALHDNNACEATSVERSDVRSMNIYGTDIGINPPSSVKEGESISLTGIVVFDDDVPGEVMALELGMYKKGSPQVMQTLATIIFEADAIASPTANCVASEEFVDTIHIFTSGQNQAVEFPQAVALFDIKAPVDADLNNGGSEDYVFQMVLFKNCYRQCSSSTGSLPIAWMTKSVTLVDDPSNNAGNHCTDGSQSGDETDLNCGGDECEVCRAGFRCDSSSDCQDGLVCESLGAGQAKVCTTPGSENFPAAIGFGFILLVLGLLGVGIYMVAKKK